MHELMRLFKYLEIRRRKDGELMQRINCAKVIEEQIESAAEEMEKLLSSDKFQVDRCTYTNKQELVLSRYFGNNMHKRVFSKYLKPKS